MKEGDLVVCKKTYENFKTNKFYKITRIHSEDIIEVENHDFYLKKEKKQLYFCYICPMQLRCYNRPTFSKIFCSLKESRKKKLKKLS